MDRHKFASIGSVILLLVMVLFIIYGSHLTREAIIKNEIYKLEHSKSEFKQLMMTLYPKSYKDTSGVAIIWLAEEAMYSFDSANNKQMVRVYRPEILQNILADLKHEQANVSLSKSLDYYAVEWDNVHYIPHVGEYSEEPKTEKK
jgi:hypothetical protein